MSEFVRKDFYLEPPAKGASVEEWEAWLKADNRKAAAHKASHTKAQEHGEVSDLPGFVPGMAIKGTGGVYRQQYTAIGFGGDWENGNGTIDLVSTASQDKHYQARGHRGQRLTAKAKNAKARKARKAQRNARFKKAIAAKRFGNVIEVDFGG